MIAEQIPAKLVPDVVKNTALKVVHRLPAADDRELVGATMNLDEDQSRQVVSLRAGRGRGVRGRHGPAAAGPGAVRRGPGGGRPGPAAAAGGPRSPACGPVCAVGARLHPAATCAWSSCSPADLLPAEPGDAWLRLWAEALVLAFLTGRALPAVPARAAPRVAGLDRGCASACWRPCVDRAVRSRALAIRTAYDPAALAGAAAGAGLRMLGRAPAGTRTGRAPGPGRAG